MTLSCAGIGALPLLLPADAPPTPAAALPAGLSLRIAYRVTDLRTGAALRGGPTGQISCGTIPVHAVLFAALSSNAAPAGVATGDRFDGAVIVTLDSIAQPLATRAATAAVPGAGAAFPFEASLRAYLSTRSGQVSVAAFDATTGATYSYNGGAQYVTASIVKVAILGTLLRQAQAAGRSLTSTERSLATQMIEFSDNNAATTLWNEVGQGAGVGAFMRAVGMPSSTPGPDGYWGLTSTNAPDQVKLVRAVAYPNGVLSDASRSYEESLMRAVTASQKWGVSAGLPSGTTVALKNGWLPRSNGWVINSIGHVSGGNRDYVIAVLSSGDPSMSYGIATVQHISGMVWNGLPYQRANVYGVLTQGGASGTVELHGLSNGSRYTAWFLHRATAFTMANPVDWVFVVGPTGGDHAADLIGVHLRNTASGRVEVHVASAASNYTAFSRHTATALAAVDPTQWQLSVGSVGGDGGADLVAVRVNGGQSGRVEVHVLTEWSNYQSFMLHAVTPLAAGPSLAAQWRFLLGRNGNLVGVHHLGTATGRTEVHVLSWASRYQSWVQHAATALGYTDDSQWRFALADQNGDGVLDLFAIRTQAGASGRTEVHVLSGAGGFAGFLVHSATPLGFVPPAWEFSTF